MCAAARIHERRHGRHEFLEPNRRAPSVSVRKRPERWETAGKNELRQHHSQCRVYRLLTFTVKPIDLPSRVKWLLPVVAVAYQRLPRHGFLDFLDAMSHRRPRRWRIVGRDFLESVDPVNGEHAGAFIDSELVAVQAVDLFSIQEVDDEHDAVLSSECGLACDRTIGPPPGQFDCGAGT